jgi:riboflavin kinase/FMN adenylyltransferase
MKIIRSLNDIENDDEVLLTIGNFDGIHRGHHFLISELKKYKTQNEKIVVITYIPHTKLFLNQISKDFLITTPTEKYDLLNKEGVDYILEINFDSEIAQMNALSFFNKYVFIYKKIKKVVLGYDFRIGMNKESSFEDVKSWCEKVNIEIKQLDPLVFNNKVCSSTLIRDLISNKSIEEANLFLNYSYFLNGLVIKGEGRGKKLKFPTINIKVDELKKIPPVGVYITETQIRNKKYKSISNIGFNPTFGGDFIKIETHILEFDQNIYGEFVKIMFIKFLRDEMKFNNVNDLVLQIANDINQARG